MLILESSSPDPSGRLDEEQVDHRPRKEAPVRAQLPDVSDARAMIEGTYLDAGQSPQPNTPRHAAYLDSSQGPASAEDKAEGIRFIELTFDTEIPELPHLQRTPTGRASMLSNTAGLSPPDLTKYESPFHWSTRRKIFVSSVAYVASMLAAYSAGSYAMATNHLTKEWDISLVTANVGITVFVLGFGFAPIILAPYSEANGRYWVFVLAGAVFFLGTLGCAVTQSYPGMIVSRFIVGSGASVFATLVGGVVSDIYHKEERNTPMALYSLTVMIGTGLGPLVSGVISDKLSWRWIFYLQMIMVGTTTLLIALVFRETRSNVVLQQKAVALNRYLDTLEQAGHPTSSIFHFNDFDVDNTSGGEKTSLTDAESQQRIRFCAPSEKRRSLPSMIYYSFKFPLRLLCTESVVFWFSLWASFAWAILYMQFSSIALVFSSNHNFDNTQIGAVFSSVIIGSILVTIVSIYQEKLASAYFPAINNTPEGRLYFSCVESAFLPIGLFWFGWSSGPSVHWIVPAIAIASCTIGIFSIYLAVFNYLADTYHRYASSALAAQSMCRNLLAGIFPLVTNMMFTRLTYGGTGSMLGGIGVLLTGVPWVLCFFGEKIRRRSPFAAEIMEPRDR